MDKGERGKEGALGPCGASRHLKTTNKCTNNDEKCAEINCTRFWVELHDGQSQKSTDVGPLAAFNV